MEDRFKFRVWDKDMKSYTTDIDPDFFVRPIDEYDEKVIEYQISVLSCQVIQWSSTIKDKNDKLIYEGDIVKIPYNSYFIFREVRWDVGFAKLICSSQEYEVIGNIYENPELLEENNEK